nr:DUF4132 domain-containing protein [Kibdelosporangium sp. MJ126-NF4]CTQ98598.1 Molybdate metabolism regulator [Kibdelosporangium sp. MJ126-NF4]
MHRWELVAGGAKKFWEARQDEVTVTVRFGRLGTAGQTHAKQLPSAEEAQAYLAKLVAEKEKKGYQRVAAEQSTPTQEDGPVILPADWRYDFLPRRGGYVPQAAVVPHADPVLEKTIADHRSAVETVLGNPDTDSSLAAEARKYLHGAATPLGAAATLTTLAHEHSYDSGRRERLRLFGDALVVRHGLPFAVQTAAECARLDVQTWTHSGGYRPAHLTFRDTYRAWSRPPLIERLRELLVMAEQREYDAAVEALAAHRTSLAQQLVVSYLVPTRTDWVDELCATAVAEASTHYDNWDLLCGALSTAEQLETVVGTERIRWAAHKEHALHALADSIGPDIAPTIARLMDLDPTSTTQNKVFLNVLTALPTDQTFDLLIERLDRKLVQPAFVELMKSHPVRTMRRLALAGTKQADGLLRDHLLLNPDLADVDMSAEERAGVERVSVDAPRLPEAPVDSLPRLLVEPPWTRERTQAKSAFVAGLEPPKRSTISWEPDEREEWASLAAHSYVANLHFNPWNMAVTRLRNWQLPSDDEIAFFLNGPAELTDELIAEWHPQAWGSADLAKRMMARYGLAAVPAMLASSGTEVHVEALHPVQDVGVARTMATLLTRRTAVRVAAIGWFARHPAYAARALVPDAVGKPGPERNLAEMALRYLVSSGYEELVMTAAREYGSAAEEAVATVLAVDPLDLLPAKIPVPGAWAAASLLPQIVLRDKQTALPTASAQHVITMLALSTKEEPYAGVPIVKELADPESLARFAWQLFERWQGADAPSKEGWALWALGWFGDDEVVRQLTPVIRAWPGNAGHAKAVVGLDVLAEIGTEVALTHLSSIAQKVPFKGLRQKAQDKIEDVAAQLGLAADQLADRLVPAFGLDDAATLDIDYGPRKFVVGFDEQLKPFVVDEDGKHRKDLPKPGARDDQELAPAEHKRFATLKKDVRTVAADQIARLELAMVTERQWTAAEFTELLVGHPLLWHIVRRLVWSTDGGLSFRVAEDRTLADVNDDTFALPDDALVEVAHPLHIGDTLVAWAELFADYEIVQPFPQLGRPTYELTQEERDSIILRRFEGVTVPVGRVLGLTKRGWQRCAPQDNGWEPGILRPRPGGGSIMVLLDPGITVGEIDRYPEQTVEEIRLSNDPDGTWHKATSLKFDALDPITASEFLADLTSLTS